MSRRQADATDVRVVEPGKPFPPLTDAQAARVAALLTLAVEKAVTP